MRPRSLPLIAVLDFYDDGCAPGSGRSFAEGLATRFGASRLFQVVDREVWIQTVGGRELSQECCFHPGWAADMARLLNADAVVLGYARNVPGGKAAITATAFDSRGNALVKAEGGNVDDLAILLITRSVARTIRICNRPVSAEVEFGKGRSLLLDIGRNSGLRQRDRLRIDCTLESVLDPYFQDTPRVFDNLETTVGEVEVLEVGDRFTLVRYIGDFLPETGDLVTLLKF
jgi:hypothetical protein